MSLVEPADLNRSCRSATTLGVRSDAVWSTELLEDLALVRMPAEGALLGEQGAQAVDATKRRVAPLAVGPRREAAQLQLQLTRCAQIDRIQEGDVRFPSLPKRGVSDHGGNPRWGSQSTFTRGRSARPRR